MEFISPLTQAVLLKRYKRFLAEIVLNNQEHRIIHCPNIGAMTGCDMLGSRIWFSHSNQFHRKFPDTWELIEVDAGYLVCINTQSAVPLVTEAIDKTVITELQEYTRIETPPVIEEFALDLLLERTESQGESSPKDRCLIGVQAVTLGDEIHRGFFPDSMTEYGLAQLKALMQAKSLGYRAILFCCSLHTGIQRIFPADHIDPTYGCLLRQALIAGVEVIGYGVDISLKEMHLVTPVEVCIPARLICSYRSEKSQ